MAENKKGFVLYCDLIHTVEQLPNDKAGELFKHILRYVNDLNPVTDDLLTKITFEPIKQQLKRDLNKWTEKSIKRSEAGRLGGLKSGEVRKQNEANEANASNSKQNEQVTDTVTVKGKVKEEEIKYSVFLFEDFWKIYPVKNGKDAARKAYDKISESDRKKIKDTLKSFIENIPFKGYNYPMASTYLNQKRYNDELTQPIQTEIISIPLNGSIDLSKIYPR